MSTLILSTVECGSGNMTQFIYLTGTLLLLCVVYFPDIFCFILLGAFFLFGFKSILETAFTNIQISVSTGWHLQYLKSWAHSKEAPGIFINLLLWLNWNWQHSIQKAEYLHPNFSKRELKVCTCMYKQLKVFPNSKKKRPVSMARFCRRTT